MKVLYHLMTPTYFGEPEYFSTRHFLGFRGVGPTAALAVSDQADTDKRRPAGQDLQACRYLQTWCPCRVPTLTKNPYSPGGIFVSLQPSSTARFPGFFHRSQPKNVCINSTNLQQKCNAPRTPSSSCTFSISSP